MIYQDRLGTNAREIQQTVKYATAAFGKWHLGFFKPGYTPTRRGFDEDEGLFQGKKHDPGFSICS
jgi:arylsulfatase A-like enzyme